MAREEKPYRVYRGGRAKGKVPTPGLRAPRVERRGLKRRGGDGGTGQAEYRGPGAPTGERKVRWGRRISLGIVVLLVLVIVWAVASWFAFSGGVSDANKRSTRTRSSP